MPCAECGRPLYRAAHRLVSSKAHFCSLEHANAWQGRHKSSHQCTMCGKMFRLSPSVAKRREYRIAYCSLACRDSDPTARARLLDLNRVQQSGRLTSCERAGYGILKDLGVAYLPQHTLADKFCVDAFVPAHALVIQFDGDYWHGHPARFPNPDHRQSRRIKLDRSQDAYLGKCGYKVLRFWESDLKSNPDLVRSVLRPYATPQAHTHAVPV